MASQGPQFTINGYDDSAVGTLTWSNPSRIRADDGSFATVGFPGGAGYNTTHYLKGDNCGFTLPSTATIDGITARIDRDSDIGGTIRDAFVRLIKGGTIVGDNKASGVTSWNSTGETIGYGGVADLWGTTWLYSDINASGFGLAMAASGQYGTGGGGSVDYYTLTVFYTVGADTHSSGCTLYIGGHSPINSGCDLFTQGHGVIDSGCPLFLDSYRTSSGIPLYTTSAGPHNSSCPLYIFNSVPVSSGHTLYEFGHGVGISGITLFLHGSGADPIQTAMSLYTTGLDLPDKTGSVPLYMYATPFGTGGSTSTIPLFINSENDPRYQLNLFVQGKGGNETQILNLFLCNDTGIASDINLFLKNNYVEVNSGISLYLECSGTEGAMPVNASMPLYMARDSEGFAGVIPLYIRVPEGQSSGIGLFIDGETTASSGLTLVMPNTYGTTTNGIRLFTHGF